MMRMTNTPYLSFSYFLCFICLSEYRKNCGIFGTIGLTPGPLEGISRQVLNSVPAFSKNTVTVAIFCRHWLFRFIARTSPACKFPRATQAFFHLCMYRLSWPMYHYLWLSNSPAQHKHSSISAYTGYHAPCTTIFGFQIQPCNTNILPSLYTPAIITHVPLSSAIKFTHATQTFFHLSIVAYMCIFHHLTFLFTLLRNVLGSSKFW